MFRSWNWDGQFWKTVARCRRTELWWDIQGKARRGPIWQCPAADYWSLWSSQTFQRDLPFKVNGVDLIASLFSFSLTSSHYKRATTLGTLSAEEGFGVVVGGSVGAVLAQQERLMLTMERNTWALLLALYRDRHYRAQRFFFYFFMLTPRIYAVAKNFLSQNPRGEPSWHSSPFNQH